MPMPSRKTANRTKRIRELHAKGSSSREIAEDLGIAHTSVSRWLRDYGLTPNGGSGARKSRRRRRTTERAPAPAPVVDALAGLSPLEHAQARLAQCSAVIAQTPPGDQTTSNLVQLGRYERDLRTEVAEHLARERRSDRGEEDESTVADAAEVVRRIRNTVEKARKAAKCMACGKNPFGLR